MVHGATSGGREKRLGRITDHARACKEYGLVSKVQGGGHEGRRNTPGEGRNYLH